MDFALWAFKIAFKVTTGFAPFKLVYGLEVVVPMDFLVSNLRIAMANKFSPEESINSRVDQLLNLK